MMERPWLKFYDEGVPAHIDYPEQTLPELLAASARRHPRRTATVFMGKSLSYAALDEAATRFAIALRSLGVQKGDRVALVLPNCPQFLIGYYGAMRLGAVVVPTNPLYVEREMEHQFKDAGVKVVLTLDLFYPKVRKVKEATGVESIVVTSVKEQLPALLALLYPLKAKHDGTLVTIPAENGVYMLPDLLKAASGPEPAGGPDPDDLALLQYTGGTTGVSKGAMLTHRNLVTNTVQSVAWMTPDARGSEPDIVLGALPYFHVYGMTVAMNLAVYLGGMQILLPRFVVHDVLEAIRKYRPTLFPGAPTMYVALINSPETQKYDLSSIRACLSGSAPLPVEVQNKFEALTGGKLVEGYGLTEASPVTHCNPLYGHRKYGKIGVPFPDTEARVVDLETGTEVLGPNQPGELCIRGPQVMKGYWNRPEETAQTLRDGWLYTGDIATVDDEGYFAIVDRKKEMIIASGYNIYPREIEEVLYGHPKVKEAAVVGVPDPYRGETVKAFIVPKDGVNLTADEILSYCKEKLAVYKVPKLVEFRKELPKSMVGKVLRRVLRDEELSRQQQKQA